MNTAADAHDLAGLRILVVEDEMMLALLVQGWLESIGCQVVKAPRLSKALSLVLDEAFDAALLDVNLAGVESYPVAEALAARGVPFAFMSGYSIEMLRDDYRRRPMLRKPFQQHDLRRVLGACVSAGNGAAPCHPA